MATIKERIEKAQEKYDRMRKGQTGAQKSADFLREQQRIKQGIPKKTP